MSRTFLVSIVLVALAGVLASEAWARPRPSGLATAQSRHLQLPAGTLLDYKRMKLPAFYRAKAWRILYVTRDYRLRPILSTGMVVLPDNAPRIPMERRFVAWAHPTTGVARKCAPSLRQSPTRAIEGLDRLVAAGIVVAATDYPGLGTEGPVGYLVGKGQAHAVIDSVRAARQIPGVGGSSTYALWGYSQGGHAVLFAADESQRYAPELRLAGAAAVAPPTDLTRLLRATIDTVEGRVLVAMTLASWSVKYGVPLAGLVDRNVEQVIAAIRSYCVDDLGEKFNLLAAQKPLKQRFLNYDPSTRRPWSSMLMENSRFAPASRVPLYIAQGTSDELVKPGVTLQYVRAACRQGVPVSYVPLKGKGHGGSIAAATPGAIKWLTDRLADGPERSNCR